MTENPSRPISMEDLRPRFLAGIFGQTGVVTRLERLVEGVRKGKIVPPNLLMHGPPGIGKTTAARAFAREVLGDEFDNSFFQLRTSDDRGIDVLRNEIIPFSRRPPSRRAPFRVIFFDEADALPREAQSALRSAMEEGSGTSVFILACNDLAEISKPMQSRCTVLEFSLLGPEEMRRLILEALSKTPFEIDEARVEAIVLGAGGIPREGIKLLMEEFGGLRPAYAEPPQPETRAASDVPTTEERTTYTQTE